MKEIADLTRSEVKKLTKSLVPQLNASLLKLGIKGTGTGTNLFSAITRAINSEWQTAVALKKAKSTKEARDIANKHERTLQ